MDKQQQQLMDNILDYVHDDDKGEAKSLLTSAVQHSGSAGISADTKGQLMGTLLGSLTGVAAQAGDKKDGGFDLGGMLGGLLGGGSTGAPQHPEKEQAETTAQRLMEYLPKLVKMVKPEDLKKVEKLLMQLLAG